MSPASVVAWRSLRRLPRVPCLHPSSPASRKLLSSPTSASCHSFFPVPFAQEREEVRGAAEAPQRPSPPPHPDGRSHCGRGRQQGPRGTEGPSQSLEPGWRMGAFSQGCPPQEHQPSAGPSVQCCPCRSSLHTRSCVQARHAMATPHIRPKGEEMTPPQESGSDGGDKPSLESDGGNRKPSHRGLQQQKAGVKAKGKQL